MTALASCGVATKINLVVLVAAGALSLSSSTALAQAYPARPIRIVVPFSPGGAVDGPMRVIAQELSKRMGQGIVVENKPGAGALIGSEIVAKSPPAGSTPFLSPRS